MVKTSMQSYVLLGAVVIGGLFYVGGKQLELNSDPELNGTITVSGDGRVFVAPDIAQLSLGVNTGRHATAAAAIENLKESMDKIIAAIKEQGVADKDIATESFWLNPVYDYTEGRQIPRGYEANQSLRVKVRDLDAVSKVLGAATSAGANQAGGVNFTVDEPEEKRAEAREIAIDEAKEKAKVLARQLGVSLGEIVNFNEGFGGGTPSPMYMERSMGMGGAMEDAAVTNVALPQGEQEINVSVSITYELD